MKLISCQAVFLIATVGSVLSGTSAVCGEDWPMFGRDKTRNALSPEKNPPTDWHVGDFDRKTGRWIKEKTRNIRWVARLGSLTFGDPVVADGLVWVGTNNFGGNQRFDYKDDASVLMCFREHDGQLLYRYVSPRLRMNRALDWPSSALGCSPLVEGDRIWFTTNRCETVCLDIGSLRTGQGEPKEVWKVDMINELCVVPRGADMGLAHTCSIAGYKDLIYVITGNGVEQQGPHVPVPEAPSLVCFNKHNGEVVWHDDSPGKNILNGQWASPLVIETNRGAQVVAPQGDGWVRSFDALTGRLIWKFDMNRKSSKWIAGGRGTRNNLLATPVLYDGRIYVASGQHPGNGEGNGRLCCIDPTKTGDISSELAVDAEGKSLPHRREQAVNPEVGEKAIANPNSGLIWEFTERDQDGDGRIDFDEEFHRSMSSVAIDDGLLMAVDIAGLVHCFDAKTGQRHWGWDTMAAVYAGPLIVDGMVYVCDEDGEVALFRLSGDPNVAMKKTGSQFEPAAEINVENSVYTTPIFANGTLYIADRTHLYAVQAAMPGEEAVTGHWPQWRGPDRTNVSKETGLLKEWPEGGPPLQWKVEGIGEGIASVSIADGRIYTVGYVEGGEYAIALDQRSGEKVWARRIGAAVQEHSLMRWLSQRSPTVDSGRVYVIRADGDLICLQATDGVELWRKSYPKDFAAGRAIWGFCDYPLVDDDKLICAPGSPETGIAALNKYTGEVIWKAKIPGVVRPGYGTMVTAVIGGVRQYVTFSDDGFFGVAAKDGSVLWHYDKMLIRYGAVHTPVVRGDQILCASGYGRSVALVKLAPTESGFGVQEQYRTERTRLDPFQDCTLLVGDHVYTVQYYGMPMCISLKTGEIVWQRERTEGTRGRVTVVYADGHLYLRHSSGAVTLVEATPNAYVEKGTFTMPDHEPSRGATFPVIAGGRLFLRDNSRLFCYDVREDALKTPRPAAKSIDLSIPNTESREKDAARLRSVFVPTPKDVVEKMLELAGVGEKDLVYDLGSGDGRIVIAAAKRYGCRAVGYEIDRELVELSRENTAKAGVECFVTIEQKDVFTVDLSKADVIAVYLLPKQLEKLIPQLEKLKPGSRIVSYQFEIPGIKPDKQVRIESNEDGDDHSLYLWTSPLKKP